MIIIMMMMVIIITIMIMMNKCTIKKPLNYFERLVSVKNNIVNSSNNNGYNQTITLIINNCRICIS